MFRWWKIVKLLKAQAASIVRVFSAVYPLVILAAAASTAGLCASTEAPLSDADKVEYQIKAAFIYNFMRFIEWPMEKREAARRYQAQNAPAAAEAAPPILIGVIGTNPFGEAMDAMTEKTVAERSIQVVQLDGLESYLRAAASDAAAIAAYQEKFGDLIKRCEILFFCGSETAHYEKLLPLMQGTAAVTISDIPNFALRGGMFGFVTEKGKIRFDIHLEPVEKEGVKVRSQLLELARQVHKKSGTRR